MRLSVGGIKYQQESDGRWIVTAGTCASLFISAGAPTRSLSIEVTRKSIDLAPDFEKLKAFELPDIPNGTMAQLQEADKHGNLIKDTSGVRYMWKDGAVVPAYNPETLERMKKALQDASTSATTQLAQ